MNPGDEILRILGGKIIHAGVILTKHAELMNPSDEILRILGGKIIHAGVILGRHAEVMKPGDESLRISGGKLHLQKSYWRDMLDSRILVKKS